MSQHVGNEVNGIVEFKKKKRSKVSGGYTEIEIKVSNEEEEEEKEEDTNVKRDASKLHSSI
jgi:hypothetical protein